MIENLGAAEPSGNEGVAWSIAPAEKPQEFIRLARTSLATMQKHHPEILTLTIFGSIVKGSPQPNDIDGYLVIDETSIKPRWEDQRVYLTDTLKKTPEVAEHIIDSRIDQHTGTLRDGVVSGLSCRASISPTRISMEKLTALFTKARNGEPTRLEDHILIQLFLPALHTTVDPYREYCIHQLETMGKKGETFWKSIAGEFSHWTGIYIPETVSAIPSWHIPERL